MTIKCTTFGPGLPGGFPFSLTRAANWCGVTARDTRWYLEAGNRRGTQIGPTQVMSIEAALVAETGRKLDKWHNSPASVSARGLFLS